MAHFEVAGPDPRRLRVAGCLARAGPTVVAQQYSILYEKTLETQPGLNDALEYETSAGFNSVSTAPAGPGDRASDSARIQLKLKSGLLRAGRRRP